MSASALAVLVSLCWAVASAPGSSPDDDLHLASIWCAWSPEGAGCSVLEGPSPGQPRIVSVPKLAIHSSNYAAFKPEGSAACAHPVGAGSTSYTPPEAYTMRANNAAYPGGFYAFMRLAELSGFGWAPFELGTRTDATVVQADHAEYRSLSPSDPPGVRTILGGRGVLEPTVWPGVRVVQIGRRGSHS